MQNESRRCSVGMLELQKLRPGDELLVTFGSKGTQRARFVRWGTCQGWRSLVVEKYRANSKKWTKPVHILPGEVKERA